MLAVLEMRSVLDADIACRGGLMDRQRSGRTVLYQASALGLALLGRAGPGEVSVATAGS
jgi:hypothetical protein